jgi:hypothetical protein
MKFIEDDEKNANLHFRIFFFLVVEQFPFHCQLIFF